MLEYFAFSNISNILVNFSLAIIMLGIGFSLTFDDFRKIFLHPKALLAGLLAQLIALPILSFSISGISNLSPEMKVAIVIIAACPVGASSSLIVHLFKGNVALSISLAVVNSIIVPFSAPLVVNIALRFYLGRETEIVLDLLETISQIFIHIVIPATVGVIVRHYKPGFALGMEKPLRIALPILLATVFIIKIFFSDTETNQGLTSHEFVHIVPWVLMLNIAGMYAGYFIGKMMRFDKTIMVTIAIEVGLQNTALALMITGSILKNTTMEKPVLVYAMLTFFTAVLFAWKYSDVRIFKKKKTD